MKFLSRIAKSVDAAAAAAQEAAGGLEHIRDLRERLLREREEIARRPATRDECVEAIDAGIANLARRWAEALVVGPILGSEGVAPRLDLKLGLLVGARSTGHEFIDVGMAGALAACAPDALRAILVAKLDEGLVDRTPMARDAQRAELARLDSEIDQAEAAEEAVIRSALASGLKVKRRRDANPKFVLAADISLPKTGSAK